MAKCSTSSDLEAAAAEDEPQADNHPQRNQLQWAALVVAFCLSSAVQNPHQTNQTGNGVSSSFISIQFHLFRLALVFALSSVFMATQLSLKFPNTARLLEHVGVLFGITAFFLIVSDSFPLGLKIATWAIYGILLSAAFFCKIYGYKCKP